MTRKNRGCGDFEQRDSPLKTKTRDFHKYGLLILAKRMVLIESSSVSIYPLRGALQRMFIGLDKAVFEEEVTSLATSIEENDRESDLIGVVAIRSMVMGLFSARSADQLRESGYEEELSLLVARVRPTEFGAACMQLGRHFQERLCSLRAEGVEEITFTQNDLDSFPEFPEEGIPAEIDHAISEFRERVSDC